LRIVTKIPSIKRSDLLTTYLRVFSTDHYFSLTMML